MFFSNADDEYLQIEVSPRGRYFLLMLNVTKPKLEQLGQNKLFSLCDYSGLPLRGAQQPALVPRRRDVHQPVPGPGDGRGRRGLH